MLRRAVLACFLMAMPSMLFGQDPQQCRFASGHIYCSRTLDAVNETVELRVAGFSAVGFDFFTPVGASGLVGTLAFEVEFQDGTLSAKEWTAVPVFVYDDIGGVTKGWYNTTGAGISLTGAEGATRGYLAIPPGAVLARVRVSAFTSGSKTVLLAASDTLGSPVGSAQSFGSNSIGTVIDPSRTWAVIPHLHDGNNVDPMESGFLVQQQGESTMRSNDGSGLIPLIAYNTSLGTFAILKGSADTGIIAGTNMEYASQMSNLGGWVSRTVTAPAAGDFLNVSAGTTQKLIFDSATISVEGAVAQVDVIATSAAGVTCTSLTVRNTLLTQTAGTTPTANHTCTTDPVTFDTILRVNLAANSTVVVDLSAYFAAVNSADGISFNVVTAPGAGNDLSINVTWRGCTTTAYC